MTYRATWLVLALCCFVLLPEGARWLHGGAFAQTNADATPSPGPTGNFNFNQQGGNNYQYYFNEAPQKLTFTDALGAELLSKLPKDKPITVVAVGSKVDQRVGKQIADFLNDHGYTASLSREGATLPPPDNPLVWDRAASVLTVAPSAR